MIFCTLSLNAWLTLSDSLSDCRCVYSLVRWWSKQPYYADVLKNLWNITQAVYWPASLKLSTGPQQGCLKNKDATSRAPFRQKTTTKNFQTEQTQSEKSLFADNCDDVSRIFVAQQQQVPHSSFWGQHSSNLAQQYFWKNIFICGALILSLLFH